VEGRIDVWTDGANWDPDVESDRGDPTQLSDKSLAELVDLHGWSLEEEKGQNALARTEPDPEQLSADLVFGEHSLVESVHGHRTHVCISSDVKTLRNGHAPSVVDSVRPLLASTQPHATHSTNAHPRLLP
jgi:hypothetical protein